MTQAQAQQQVQVQKQSTILQTALKPLPTALSGKGCYITVKDHRTGEVKTLLDGSSGAAVSSVGHGDEEIRAKMHEAVNDQIYTFPVITCNAQSEKLADFLIEKSPKGAFAAATFTGSGSEANENMLKIVRKYHIENGDLKRVKFIGRIQSYHGYTLGCLAISDNSRKVEFEDILAPASITPKAQQCYPYRMQRKGESLEQYKGRLLKDLEDVFINEGPETIGAFIAETVTGSTYGCNPPVPGYLDGCKAICEKYGALFVLDEVMCGMGRCGSLNAWEQFMTTGGPDIQTIGKALGAGYVTIAGVLFSPKVVNLFKSKKSQIVGAQTYHSHSFNCQVSYAVMDKVINQGLIENIKENGDYLGSQLQKVIGGSKYVGDVRGSGGFWAIEFVKDKETKEPFPANFKFSARFSEKLYDNGVFCLSGGGTADGKLGDHILFSPAYSITKEEVDVIVDACKTSIEELEKELDENI